MANIEKYIDKITVPNGSDTITNHLVDTVSGFITLNDVPEEVVNTEFIPSETPIAQWVSGNWQISVTGSIGTDAQIEFEKITTGNHVEYPGHRFPISIPAVGAGVGKTFHVSMNGYAAMGTQLKDSADNNLIALYSATPPTESSISSSVMSSATGITLLITGDTNNTVPIGTICTFNSIEIFNSSTYEPLWTLLYEDVVEFTDGSSSVSFADLKQALIDGKILQLHDNTITYSYLGDTNNTIIFGRINGNICKQYIVSTDDSVAIQEVSLDNYLTIADASNTYAATSSLASIAFSGDYDDLTNLPTTINISGAATIGGNIYAKSHGYFDDDVYVGNTSVTEERDLYVQAQSGGIVLYSEGTTNGKRGLWIQAHGTGSAGDVIAVDTNNKITYTGGSVSGTLNISGAATVGGALRTGAITGTSTMNISGNSTVGGTLRAANTITVTTGGITITAGGLTATAGNIQASAGYIIATNNHLYAGSTSNTSERRVYARSGAGEIYLFSGAATNGSRGLYAVAHGTGSALTMVSVDTNNVPYVAATMRAASGNNSASRLRNITCQNSAGTATSTNYLITRRLS